VHVTTNKRAHAYGQHSVMAREVWEGLARAQKEIPSKYFYDTRGSALFDAITRLPEYYLTRAEGSILRAHAAELVAGNAANVLVELGPGSGEKTRLLLDPLTAVSGAPVYVPLDISESYLEQLRAQFSAAYPGLTVRPALCDISRELKLPGMLKGPLLVAFLGSTIGNFEPHDATALLQRVAAVMRVEDRLLVGFDLKKDEARLNAAYNDTAGVTAEFNLNVLRVLNHELTCDFDLTAFRHCAFYNTVAGRIEMHLISERKQRVRIGSLGFVHFAEGESVRTEISCKYDRTDIEMILQGAGLEVIRFDSDDAGLFALVTAASAG
jgi:L-histidine Nalpha-methyltransferase